MFNNKKSAFTLAEILIALAIIGAIAAITIPQIVERATAKANVVKLKRAYASLKDALRLASTRAGYNIGDITAISNSDVENNPYNAQDLLSTALEATPRSGERYEYGVSGKYIALRKRISSAVEIQFRESEEDDKLYNSEEDLLLVGKNGANYIFKRRQHYEEQLNPDDEEILNSEYTENINVRVPYILYIDVNGSHGPNEMILCTSGLDTAGQIPDGNGPDIYIEPEPCVVDDSAVTDIYPFIMYESEIAPATSAVTAVLAK